MKLLTTIILFASLAVSHSLATTETPRPKTAYGSWDSITATSVPKGTAVGVAGWGADSAASPTTSSGIVAKIFVDGALVAEVPMNGDRPDVVDYYGFKNSGFSAVINTSNLSLGEHTIEIRVGGGPSGWNHYVKPLAGKGTITITDPNIASPVVPTKPARGSPAG